MELRKEEIFRKALHLIALIIPFGILYFPHGIAVYLIVTVTAVFFTAEILRMRLEKVRNLFVLLFGPFLRERERKRFTGASFLLLSGLLSIFLFEKEIAFTALSFIILGDAAAALIGMRFGTIFIGKKTLEGSIACAAACMLFWLLFPRIGLSYALLAAFLTALLELMPLKIDDNLIVPMVTGAILQLIR